MGNIIRKLKQKIREEITSTQNKKGKTMTSQDVPRFLWENLLLMRNNTVQNR
jgi:hypothetical protein